MNLNAHWDVFRLLVLPVVVSAIAISVVLIAVYRLLQPKEPFAPTVFIIVFGVLGGVFGVCVGSSRESVVGTVLPGILTLLTAILTFAFTKDSTAKIRSVIPYSLIALLVMSLHWTFMGSKIRFEFEYRMHPVSAWGMKDWEDFQRFEIVDLQLEKAQKFKAAGIPLTTETENNSLIEPPKPEFPQPKR